MADIEHARKIINEVDAQMAQLFVRRMQAAEEVAAYKKERGLPILDAAREKAVLAAGAERMENPIYRSYYTNFLQEIMEISKRYQHRLTEGMRVAFSGVKGAFADIAARGIFPDAECVPYPDFASAYEAVESGACDCAVLPIENSYNGDVGQVMDLAFFGDLHIHQVCEVEIVQNLLAVKGTTMDEVKTVISHPQALGQCAGYIRKHGFATKEAVNTAIAAEEVARAGRHDLAAIGSDEAAQAFGLKKLEAHINESSGNTTRFAVFSRVAKTPDLADNQFVMAFTVNNEAGSLGKAIEVIGANGFNLRALKSRPTKKLCWSYYFYVEGDGNIYGVQGQKMLGELMQCCNNVRLLGSFAKE